ncbi:MAG: TetR/AcrR family transcriptional regulator [Candidatus Promineifilaceae bacterium]
MPKETFFNLPEEKRQRILDLAIEEFAHHDYQNASISRIVAEASIAKGSFYQYFEDKADLYRYLLNLIFQEKQRVLATIQPPDPQMGTFAFLRWLFSVSINFEFINPKLAQMGYRAMNNQTLPEEIMTQGKEAGRMYFKQLVQAGMARGDLRSDLDVDAAAFLINTLITEFGYYLIQRLGLRREELGERWQSLTEKSAAANELFDQLMNMLELGLGKGKA